MNNTRILLGDDHSLILDGIRGILAEHYQVVGSVDNGRALVDAAVDLKPDLVVFDINMPILNGIDAAIEIRKALRGTKLVCLSMHANAIYLSKALEAGASAYVLKSGASEELLEAIAVVLNGGTWVSPGFSQSVLDSLRSSPLGSTVRLTKRQRQILQLIAEGRANKEIAFLLGVSIRTVEFHRYQLMARLGLHTVADLTRFAIQEGLASGDTT
jgi:DNA-binding NarL/FixJ family response regulator